MKSPHKMNRADLILYIEFLKRMIHTLQLQAKNTP